jgi:hypothetical protein
MRDRWRELTLISADRRGVRFILFQPALQLLVGSNYPDGLAKAHPDLRLPRRMSLALFPL